MALTSYSENIKIRYKAVPFSRASLFNFIILLLAIILPYLLAYRSQGFWTKLELIREQPSINFKHQALFILETDKSSKSPPEDVIWSTFPGLSQLLPRTQNDPFILSQEFDINNDGVNDWVDLSFEFPLLQGEQIIGIHMFLLFDYKLFKFANLKMEGLGYVGYQSPRVGHRYELVADLGLVQKTPMWNHLRDIRFNKEVIPRTSSRFEDYTVWNILERYSGRNVSTSLKNKYEIWMRDTDAKDGSDKFKVKVKIYYPEEAYQMWSGFWHTLKWALIQYLALFIIVLAVLRKFQRIVHRARIFETKIDIPWENLKSK